MERFELFKSQNDLKEYTALVLQNGLKLMLVSDAECDKAAVSVSVGVGSMCDPDNIQGLAHLCEHLLSIEKINQPGHRKPFSTFVSENGGMFNAFTARDQTNFYFDIGPSVFPEALHRFSSFFITAANLTKEDVLREISIVDSEHKSKVNKDSWRKMGVDASTAKKNHPYHKFTTGNKTTLWEVPLQNDTDIVKSATEFRKEYYVSRLMTVVVYGKESLKCLEELCVPLWNQVPDRPDAKVPEWTEYPFGNDELQQRIDIVAMADIKDFYVVFPTPNMRPFYKTFPMGYITRLLGNRGPGSLYSYLYDKHWVEYSYMNSSIPARGFGELSIGFQLSNLGLDHVDDIVWHVFQYLKMLKDEGPQHYFWQEMQEILKHQFTYQEKEIPVEFAQRITNLMHVYPIQDVLSVGSIISEYNPEVLEKFLNILEPENCRVITVCKENESKTENFCHDHWYGTKFTCVKFSEEQIKKWKFCEANADFYLPKPNKFIPRNFELKGERKKKEGNDAFTWSPILIMDTPLCKARFLQDDQFKTAKGVVRLEMFSPLPLYDPVPFIINQTWFRTLKNILSEEYHQATIAGSYHEIKPTLYGAEITVSGFSDKLMTLMEEIMKRIACCLDTIDSIKNHYSTVQQRYANGLKNSKNYTMQNVSTYFLSLLLREKRFSNEQLLSSLADATVNDLENYIKQFFFRTHFEWMLYGNFTENEALQLVKQCFNFFQTKWNVRPLLLSQNIRLREILIKKGKNIFKSKCTQQGSACTVLLQTGVLTLREFLCLEIIDQIVFEPLFSQLRNQEQIGYIVRSSVRTSNGCQGLLIFVQGDHECKFLSKRIFFALSLVEARLKCMDDTLFRQHKNSVRIRKSERSKTIFILFKKLWNTEIFPRRYDFQRIAKELTVLEEIGIEEVVRFYEKFFGENSPHRRILEIHLFNEFSQQSSVQDNDRSPNLELSPTGSQTIIDDIQKWKMCMKLCQNMQGE